MVLGTDTDLLVMLVALSSPDLNTSIYMLCQHIQMAIDSIPQIQTLTLKPHLLALHVLLGCKHNSAPYRLRKKVVAALKTEDHRYLEAFTKYTNTHDNVGKPLLKSPTPMISCKGWWNIPSESVWSRATTLSGQVPLHHVQQARSSANHCYPQNFSYKHCLQTVLHHSTMRFTLFNSSYEMT